jgi:hypothetical protein
MKSQSHFGEGQKKGLKREEELGENQVFANGQFRF